MRWLLAVLPLGALIPMLADAEVSRARASHARALPERELEEPVATAPATAIEPAPGEPPRDPVSRGEGSLRLALVDADTGEAVEEGVHLYRIDAPGNEHWTRGDQLQGKFEIGTDGRRVTGLAPGRYRVFVPGQRAGTTDERAFLVDGPGVRRTVAVPVPRAIRVRLMVVDADRRRLTRGELASSSYSSSRTVQPSWLVPREPRRPSRRVFGGRHRMGCGGGSGRSALRSGDDGRFRLGTLEENSRAHRRSRSFTWMRDGRSSVRVRVDGERAGLRCYCGVSVPVAPVRDAVLLPDGTRAVDAGASLRVWSDAVEDGARLPPIRVRCRLEGYETLEFSFDPRVAPSPRFLAVSRDE